MRSVGGGVPPRARIRPPGAMFALAWCLAAAAQPVAAQVFDTERVRVRAEVVVSGLQHPWAVAELPDGRLLVTERAGRLRVVADGALVPEPVAGVPAVLARGQGGLLDLVLHPDYAANGWLYFSYAKPGAGGGRTALARARLDGHRLVDFEPLFVAGNAAGGGRHFGSRIAFAEDGTLYLTVGERGKRKKSQVLSNHFGTVVRLRDDGSVPDDNPFVGFDGARPEIFSYGHRNPQALDVRPLDGSLWLTEHGPRGGDEVNRLRAGANYGWPVITHGRAYSGFRIGEGTAKEGMEPPVWHWTPSNAPSGMAFYDGDAFPAWRGNLFAGALKFRYLARLVLEGDRIVHEETLFRGAFGRIRDVRVAADGTLLVLTDERDGKLVRIRPDDS